MVKIAKAKLKRSNNKHASRAASSKICFMEHASCSVNRY